MFTNDGHGGAIHGRHMHIETVVAGGQRNRQPMRQEEGRVIDQEKQAPGFTRCRGVPVVDGDITFFPLSGAARLTPARCARIIAILNTTG